MKIGLIADTHLPSAGPELSAEIAQAFEGVDLILHSGDIYIVSCLDWLEGIAPVKAVLGLFDHLQGDPRVESQTRVLELEGHSIGMAHELIIPGMRSKEIVPKAIDRFFPDGASMADAMTEVFGAPVDIVVAGFTHETHHRGAPRHPVYQPRKRHLAEPEDAAGDARHPGPYTGQPRSPHSGHGADVGSQSNARSEPLHAVTLASAGIILFMHHFEL